MNLAGPICGGRAAHDPASPSPSRTRHIFFDKTRHLGPVEDAIIGWKRAPISSFPPSLASSFALGSFGIKISPFSSLLPYPYPVVCSRSSCIGPSNRLWEQGTSCILSGLYVGFELCCWLVLLGLEVFNCAVSVIELFSFLVGWFFFGSWEALESYGDAVELGGLYDEDCVDVLGWLGVLVLDGCR